MKYVSKQTLYMFILTIVLFGSPSCGLINHCDRDGCDAVNRSRSDYGITRGIGGYVASESDVVSNGCQECGFSSATLKIWSTAAIVSDAAAAQSVVSGTSPTVTFVANSIYEKELDAGYYLVCALNSHCASVAVPETGVFTINIKGTFGPGLMTVFAPGSSTPQSEGVFDVNYQ